jgi:hypothetical protein
MEGLRDILQRHQRLGNKFGLEFMAKSFKLRLTNHLLGRSAKSIHGSAIQMMSGLCVFISFFKASLVGELAIPLIFPINTLHLKGL